MSKPVIICVDDEPAVLESLKIELKRVLNDSCLIETAEGGEEALDLIQELQAGEYDVALVLADYIMPGIKGDELLREIHGRSPHTLNIMISGQANLEAVSKAIREAKLFRYIAKPWQSDDLQTSVIDAIQSFLQDRKLEAQNHRLQQLYQQVQELNEVLEQQVQERTAQLQRLLEFEAMLARITHKVRESLDEHQILQTVVKELATELELSCCGVTLYTPDQQVAEVCYDYSQAEVGSAKGSTMNLNGMADLYTQVLRGEAVQCSTQPSPADPYASLKQKSTMLICPLQDEQGVIGDLCLFKPRSAVFDDLEMRTVERVADQCAIALRQSRLYQLSQTQVQELERLSQVKDEFLSSISHELRSPLSTIRMAIQMLEGVLRSLIIPPPSSELTTRYIQILKDECQRETQLIDDLLDMARLEAGAAPLHPTCINLALWLPMTIEPFVERTRNQQTLLLDIATDMVDITTDPSYLERVLSELLHNACKYTPLGETILLSAGMINGIVHISVKNSGVEIPAREYERIFDKFYRIANSDRRRQGGTGLGLALVKKQIERLHGTIAVASEPGWTMFTLQVPDLNRFL